MLDHQHLLVMTGIVSLVIHPLNRTSFLSLIHFGTKSCVVPVRLVAVSLQYSHGFVKLLVLLFLITLN